MSKVRTIHLLRECDDEDVAALNGEPIDESHYDKDKLWGGEDVDVFKPNGQLLFKLRHKVLPLEVCEKARPALKRAGRHKSPHRWEINSNNLGNYNYGSEEQPDCRKTAWTAKQFKPWMNVQPFIRAVDGVFQRELRSRWSAQRKLAYQLSDPKLMIGGDTAFTTMTVNLWDDQGHDAQTPVHKDSGDLEEGFGVISVLSSGSYTGGYLVFPKYRVAVDLRTTDVLLCDVHEYHANAPILKSEPGWERIATICYFQTDILRCPRSH